MKLTHLPLYVGHFPLPGQATKPHAAFAINTLYSASAAADTYAAAFAQTATVAAAATAANPAASVARQARRLYVGSIPPGANEVRVIDSLFFSLSLLNIGSFDEFLQSNCCLFWNS